MPDLEIKVGDRPFLVSCQPGEEHFLRAAAAMLDTEARAILTTRRDMRPIAANAIHRLHAEGWTNPAIADQLRTVTASGVRVFLNRTTPDPAHP